MFGITSKIKFLGNTFFIWAVPLTIIVLNILEQRDIINFNLLLGMLLGLSINIIWKIVFSLIDRYNLHAENRRSYKLI